jgi:outer membrane lipoprotein-sorting protein
MKTTARMTTRLGIAALLAIALSPAAAQSLQQPVTLPLQQSNLAQNTQPTSTRPNLTLFAKASANFFQSDRYQTESQMQVKGGASGSTFMMETQIKSIVQSPDKFRSEITFAAAGSQSQQKSYVISDGKQVWIYRPDLKQYSVSTYQKFNQSDETFMIGLSSFLFLQLPADARQEIAKGSLSDPKVLEQLGLSSLLKGSQRSIEGRQFYAYEYFDAKEGYTLGALIDPQVAAVKQLQIAGKSEGLDITITEQILQRSTTPTITANTFRFSPPPGTKKVDKLSINPF